MLNRQPCNDQSEPPRPADDTPAAHPAPPVAAQLAAAMARAAEGVESPGDIIARLMKERDHARAVAEREHSSAETIAAACERLRESLTSAGKENATLREVNDTAGSRLAEARADIAEHEQTIDALQEDAQRLTSIIASTGEDARRIAFFKEEVRRLTNALAAAKEDAQRTAHEAKELRDELMRLRNAVVRNAELRAEQQEVDHKQPPRSTTIRTASGFVVTITDPE